MIYVYILSMYTILLSMYAISSSTYACRIIWAIPYAHLQVVQAEPSDEGNYSCVASNLMGSTTLRFSVTVHREAVHTEWRIHTYIHTYIHTNIH